jgi:acyl-CoA thioesterase-1
MLHTIVKLIVLLPLFMATALHAKEQKAILVVGDSLSSAYGIDKELGWTALLQNRLAYSYPGWEVVNASVSGDTSRTGLNRLGSAIEAHRPDILIIALGGNDGLRGLPLSELENSLASMITLAQKKDIRVILAAIRMPPNYGPAYNNSFTSIYTQLADEYSIRLIPRLLDKVADQPELMQEDGMHPKAEGQPLILENVWIELEPELAALNGTTSDQP